MLNPKICRVALWWVLILLPGAVLSADESPKSFVSIQLENDAFTLLNHRQDDYYTHGTLYSVLKIEEPPEWLSNTVEWSPFNDKSNSLDLVQYTVGHKVFTPNDTASTMVVTDDRPYAGYLFFGISSLSHSKQGPNADFGNLVELNIGLVGPSALGEQAQTFIHNLLGYDSPKGWDNQLKNELTLGVSYSRLFRWFEPLSEGLMVGLNRHDSVALGNAYTYLSSGVMIRFGKNLKRDLSPPTISPGFPGLPYFQAVKESNWYIYGGLEGRLVIRDIFLDGNTFADSHSVDKEIFVADAQIGFVYMYSDFRIAISKMFRTEEFKTQQKNESFGEINLSYQY